MQSTPHNRGVFFLSIPLAYFRSMQLVLISITRAIVRVSIWYTKSINKLCEERENVPTKVP